MKKKQLALAMMVFLALVFIMTPMIVFARPMDTIQHRYENGEAFVPLRLTAYAHDATVEWDGPNQTVYVTTTYGDILSVVVSAVGGFNEAGVVWIPYSFAVSIFEPAQEESSQEQAEQYEEARPDIHGLISRIEYGDNVAYIFGAVHAGLPEWFPLNPVVEDAMARADVFAFETNLTEEPTPEIMEQIANLMVLPDGLTLEDVLPPDVFEHFIANLATFPVVTYEDVATLTPVAANNHILGTEIVQFMNLRHDIAVDRWYMLQHALQYDKPVIGLNDSFVEASMFLDIPMDIQVNLLENFADWYSTIELFTGLDLAYAYEIMDFELLAEAMIIEFDIDTIFGMYLFERVVVERGHIFANEIARLLQETEEPTTFFVAIGIGHIMGGDFGQVFALLEAMGFDVVPLWQ